jgi:cell division transport system permease protein
MSLEYIVKQTNGQASEKKVFNNAAQVWNHTFYWHCLAPKAGGDPTGNIKAAIDKSFGSFADFKKQFAGTSFAELAAPDILAQTFHINMKDPSQADIVIEQLSGKPGVESVDDQRALLDPIFSIMNAASYTAIGIAGLMLVAAVLLISTTIRLSAFSRRRELGIMRLVGASNRFIETPFILEGVLAALIGSLLAGGAIIAIVQFFVQGYLQQTITNTAFVSLPDALIVAPILLLVGAVLAALSASVAIRRYLKV